MELRIDDWEGRGYSLDLDSITGREYEEIEKVTGILPDDFLTNIVQVEFEVDEDGEPVLQVGEDGQPVLDSRGRPKQKVAKVRMPSGGTVRALLWLFLKRDGQAVRLSQTDVNYVKFVKVLAEAFQRAAEEQEEAEVVEPESPKGETSSTSSTSSGTTSGSPGLSAGS